MEGSFPVTPVTGMPAAVRGKTLYIADLHIGIEREYWRAGVRVSGLSGKVRERVEQVLDITRPKRIIVAGDLKHNIPDFTQREAEEVRNVAELIQSQGELIIVKGNHDGDLERILQGVTIYPGSGLEENGIYVLHGHARPSEDAETAKMIVMGHVHPAIAFKHRFGVQMEKVFLFAEWRGVPVLVLPAFSPVITGMDVTNRDNFIGPVAKEFDGAEAFLLDGTYVGRVL